MTGNIVTAILLALLGGCAASGAPPAAPTPQPVQYHIRPPAKPHPPIDADAILDAVTERVRSLNERLDREP